MKYSETPGGRIRAALGLPYPPYLLEDQDQLVARGEEIRKEAERRQRAYGAVTPWSVEAGEAAAVAEGFGVAFVSSYELAGRMNERDPLNRVGVAPESGSKGFAMAVRTSGGIRYEGDPAAIAQLQQTIADAERRQAEAAQMSRQVLGPLANTVG